MQASAHDVATATDLAATVEEGIRVDERGGPGTMRAVVQRRYGSADVLGMGTVDRPGIGEHQVLIEVVAAGVDRGVVHLMTGLPYLVRLAGYGVTKPRNPTPGLDVSGRVVAVGDSVTRFVPGEDVFGIAAGSFAEYAVASEDKLALKPSGVGFEQAAVSAVSGITALQALTDVADVQPGQRVLVIGASGGVGTFAVQIAKALGAHVTAVAGTRNLELVRSLGADEVVDHQRQDFTSVVEPCDAIIDIGGRNSVRRLRSVLSADGTLVIVGGEGGNRVTGGVGRQVRAAVLSPFVSQKLAMFISTEHHSFIERLGEFLESGAVVPAIGDRFDLENVPEAVRRLEAGESSAKSVILVGDDRAGG